MAAAARTTPPGGPTDDLGYGVARDPVSVHDLHATMLHQLGIDRERLTCKFRGLDFMPTGAGKSRVVSEIIA